MITTAQYGDSQAILNLRVICLCITVLFISFGVYSHFYHASGYDSDLVPLTGIAFMITCYFHGQYSLANDDLVSSKGYTFCLTDFNVIHFNNVNRFEKDQLQYPKNNLRTLHSLNVLNYLFIKNKK